MSGRIRRHADTIAAALGAGLFDEPQPALDEIAVSGVSKRLDRELRKERDGREDWRELDEDTMAPILNGHVGASVGLLCHPNGRVRMAVVERCAEPTVPTGTLRTMVHRCTDGVPDISEAARAIVGAALATELTRGDDGALTTPVARAVAELRISAELVSQCPSLVIDALELTTASSGAQRKLNLRVTHQYSQLADYLSAMTVDTEASELARQQLLGWLRQQVSLYGHVLNKTERDR